MGGRGKSYFQRAYNDKSGERCLKVCNGDLNNMMYRVVHCSSPEAKEVVFLDQPRSAQSVNFEFVEMVKGNSIIMYLNISI